MTELANGGAAPARDSGMAEYFFLAAMLHGAIAVVITFVGIFGDWVGLFPTPVYKIMSSTEAGTWFTVGYLSYLIVGVMAMAVTSLFYIYLERILNRPYVGAARTFAWLHLLLANAGVMGAAFLTMAAGYAGGAAMQPPQLGGLGWNISQVSANILQYYPLPISLFLTVTLAGFVFGGIGYMMALIRPEPEEGPSGAGRARAAPRESAVSLS